jgi:regulator of cell morphogenesis and NO signaling
MTISSNITVREVVLRLPNATRVFEKVKIDYCCGGQRQLGDACAEAGIDLQQLNELLADAAPRDLDTTPDFNRLTLSELIQHILDKHHVYTKEEMVRLTALIGKVVDAHGTNHPELLEIQTTFQQLCTDLTPHMFKEEQILFPFVVELERSQTLHRHPPFAPFGTVNNPIRMMMMEHDAAGDILRQLRTLSADYRVRADACISYDTLYKALEAFEQDLHQHIHLENNLLFPKAIELERSV